MRLAFDDTDDAEGGCTTALVAEVLAALPEYALQGMPRLVRLNPNVPMKTRGNGAVCIELVQPTGPRVQVGMWDGAPVHAYPDGAPIDDPALSKRAWAIVSGQARPGAKPALVVAEDLPAAAYLEAVTGRIDSSTARHLLETCEAQIHHGADEQGIVGAMGAAAWQGPATSYELIAYRRQEALGTPRRIDARALMPLDDDGTTFHSADNANDVPCCVPHTPCPVLAGLRGLDPERLLETALPAVQAASAEPIRGWFLFATNQASGDHVVEVHDVGQAPTWATLAVPVSITGASRDIAGGHVHIPGHDSMGHPMELMAYEPTKAFRRHVRALREGDRILAVGAWQDGCLRLEKFRVDDLAEPFVKQANPTCPQCGRSMKSKGRDAGYRCPDGHGAAPEQAAITRRELRKLRPGWYEVPVMARRHLHRPIMFETLSAHSKAL